MTRDFNGSIPKHSYNCQLWYMSAYTDRYNAVTTRAKRKFYLKTRALIQGKNMINSRITHIKICTSTCSQLACPPSTNKISDAQTQVVLFPTMMSALYYGRRKSNLSFVSAEALWNLTGHSTPFASNTLNYHPPQLPTIPREKHIQRKQVTMNRPASSA